MQDLNQRAWPVFASIDWGGENHQLCVVAPDGKQLLETRVSHDVAGLRQLDQFLNGFGSQVPIAIERSEGESQLRMILEAYHPAPVRLFSSVDRQITLSFVTDYPTPANASRVKSTRMAGFLARHHYTGRVPAQTLADRMRQNLLSGSPGTVAGKSFSALAFTQVLQLLNTQLAEYDDTIAAATAEHPDAPIFASFPGIGPVLTAVLLAEIGEGRARFPQPEVLLAEAGLAPVTRSSGRSRSVRFRYAANSKLREATMSWAFNSINLSPWAAAAFREARDQRGQRYHRALRGLAARWTRILWRCWTNHETYDRARHGSAALIPSA